MDEAVSLWLGLVIVCSVLLWWWNEVWYLFPLKFKCSASATKLPRGHLGLPFIGETFSFLWYFKFLRRPDDFINARRYKYGDGECMFRTHLFGSPSIIAYTPSLSKFVLQSSELFQLEWPTAPLLGLYSIVNVHGKAHSRVRRFVAEAINRPDSIRRIVGSVQPLMVNALQSWAQMGQIKAKVETRKLTFENIGKLFVSLEAGASLHALDKLLQGVVAGTRAYPIKVPGFAYHHAFQCRKKVEDIFYMELDKRRNKSKVQTMDLMDGLIHIEDEEGNRLSDREVVENIVSLVIGGYTSTALASMWAISLLAKHPSVLTNLREENMALKKENRGDFITAEDVSNLKYTKKVVEETLRLANVASIVFRKVMKEVDYKGYKMPKGWKVLVFLRYVHADPKNFDDPFYFNPERWNEPPKQGTHLVFGAGERTCVGNTLARVQLTLLLHHLSVGYKWELVNPNADLIYLPHLAPVDDAEVTFSKL